MVWATDPLMTLLKQDLTLSNGVGPLTSANGLGPNMSLWIVPAGVLVRLKAVLVFEGVVAVRAGEGLKRSVFSFDVDSNLVLVVVHVVAQRACPSHAQLDHFGLLLGPVPERPLASLRLTCNRS